MRRMSHRLDPRTKLALSIMAAAVVISASSLPTTGLVYLALLAFMPTMGAHKGYCRWLLLVLPMALFFGLVTGLTFDFATGAASGLKLLSLTTIGYLFFHSTPPEDLANALIKTGLPFQAAFVVSAGMQFVPVLGRKARDVIDAQKARGIPLAVGWQLIRQAPALMIPLLIQAFQLAEELAEAMESRGFGRPGRSFYISFELKIPDYLAMAMGTLVSTSICWILW